MNGKPLDAVLPAENHRTKGSGTRLEVVGSLALLAAVTWAAHSWHSRHFGFYADDYTLVTQAMASNWRQVWAFASDLLLHFGGQGRPLQHSVLFVLSYLAGRLGGLPAAYGIGYLVVAANPILFYALLRRVSSQSLALLGGLAWALFPADTTPSLLFHSLGLQQSLTYLLLAFHCYLFRRTALSYLLVLGSLLSYETAFLVFLAAPLLLETWDRTMATRLLRHALVLGAMMTAVTALRILVGESRVVGIGFPAILTTPLLHMVEGPLVSLGTFAYRPIQTLLTMNPELALVVVLAFAVLAGALWRLEVDDGTHVRAVLASLKARTRPLSLPEAIGRPLRLALAGLAMLVLAYPLTFTIRAYALSGRDTRVHFAAVVGASLVFAGVATLILLLADAHGKGRLARLGLAALLALLVGFGFVVQADYAQSWRDQRSFWVNLVRLCPDVGEGTVILVDPTGLHDTRQIDANTWNLPRILNQIYVFPSDWEEPPRVYRLVPGWEEYILTEDGRLRIDASTVIAPPSLYRTVASIDVILVDTESGEFTRRRGLLEIGGREHALHEFGSPMLPDLSPGFLFGYLLTEDGSGTMSGGAE
jgi:hypothetical protein